MQKQWCRFRWPEAASEQGESAGSIRMVWQEVGLVCEEKGRRYECGRDEICGALDKIERESEIESNHRCVAR